MSIFGRLRNTVQATTAAKIGNIKADARQQVNQATQALQRQASGLLGNLGAVTRPEVGTAGINAGAAFARDITGVARGLADRLPAPLQAIGAAAPAGTLGGQLGAVTRPFAGASATPGRAIPGGWPAAPVWGALQDQQTYYEAWRLHSQTQKAWKHLFHVSVLDFASSDAAGQGVERLFNLFALDVSFTGFMLTGEAVPLGSGIVDNLTGIERVEVRVTTYDDRRGTLERWFMAKCRQAANQDGTFGLPRDYLVVLTIQQMPASLEVPTSTDDGERLTRKYLMRPVSIEVELSRRDPGPKELQMTFAQWDTFQVEGR